MAGVDSFVTRLAAAADPASVELWQDRLLVSWGQLGALRRKRGDLAGAKVAFTETGRIATCMAAADPDNPGWQEALTTGAIPWATPATSRAISLAPPRLMPGATRSPNAWQRQIRLRPVGSRTWG